MTARVNESIAPTKVYHKVTSAIGVSATASVATTPTNVTKIADGAADGCRIHKVELDPRSGGVASRVNLFKSTDGGTTWQSIRTSAVTGYTDSTTAAPTAANKPDFGVSDTAPILLPTATDCLGVGFMVAQPNGWVANVEGGIYVTA